MLEYLWTVPLAPLLAFAVIILFTRWNTRLSQTLSIGAIAYGMVYAILVLVYMLGQPAGYIRDLSVEWIKLGDFKLEIGMYVDALTAIMLLVVGIVALLVHIYSVGYMHDDPRKSRYFSFLSLFTFSMLGLVLSNNFAMIFVFWELVGVSSYLLIGFWYEKKSAADAGKKAFITNRIGDFGFVLGILLMLFTFGTVKYSEVFHLAHAEAAQYAPAVLAAIGILLFCGAIGKSAQFPLHVWLPDAMEGPTPVSALIHAATMVAAGVYMVARSLSIYHASHTAALVVAMFGGFTAFLAASIGLVQNDIKRVLAYSTVSQLGYMIMALGLGAFTAGTFHLMTHAFFKACLFLGAGSVIHAVHAQDIQVMGGLSRKLKITSATFVIASLSIAGIFPLSGFWSKDEIIAATADHPIFLVVALGVAFMTAFYMFRLVFLTFFGQPREQHLYEHAHESPRVMTWPLIILAFLSIVGGWVGLPWLHRGYSAFVLDYAHEPHHAPFNFLLGGASTAVALSGIGLAYLMYLKKAISPVAIARKFKPIYTFLYNKWYFDELYAAAVINPTLKFSGFLAQFDKYVIDGLVNFLGKFTLVTAWLHNLFDKYVVDGAVNGVGYGILGMGSVLKQAQTGRLYNYAFVIVLGVVVILFFKLF